MATGGPPDEQESQVHCLAQLVIEGDFDAVRQRATAQLVKAEVQHGRSVLMLVADEAETPVESEKCVLYLLHLGADAAAADSAGETAAHLAARRGHLRLLALLPFSAKWERNRRGATPLIEAALANSWRCAKHLLHLLRQKRHNGLDNDKRLRLLGLQDADGRTALDLARRGGHTDIAKDIEREMRLVLKYGEISGLTASEAADRRELERLAEAGDATGLQRAANRGNCDLPDRWGRTALMRAAWNSECGGNEALWQQLLQLADPTCADILGVSCLHHAAWGGNFFAASALLDAGAAANARDLLQSTPLMRAPAAAVGRVLLAAGSDWSLKNSDGRTALDRATSRESRELAELLRGFEGQEFFGFTPPAVRVLQAQASFRERSPSPPFLERWDTGRLIGRGGFGEVHEVLTDKGIRCAAKSIKLPVQLGNELDAVSKQIAKSIEGERNLCHLRHPNIVRFLHIALPRPETLTVMVFMELLDGRSLEQFIASKPLDEASIRNFSREICSALLYLHSQQPPVIHRDINCSNIIVLTDSRRIKLIDFGLSIKLEQSFSHLAASSATPRGTLNFMAPELLGAGDSDSVVYSRESDIWAFGCTVFQMASGARPFAKVSNFVQLALLLERNGAPALPDRCSAELKDFYSCSTAKDRRKRKSAGELMGHAFLTGGKLKGFFSWLFGDKAE